MPIITSHGMKRKEQDPAKDTSPRDAEGKWTPISTKRTRIKDFDFSRIKIAPRPKREGKPLFLSTHTTPDEIERMKKAEETARILAQKKASGSKKG